LVAALQPTMTRRLPLVALAAVLAWLVAYPLLLTLLEAAAGGSGAFADLARRPDAWLALWRSLWTSLASVALAGAVGVPLAFVFGRLDFPGRRTLAALVALPVALPPLVGVIAFLFLYGESGFLARGLVTLLRLDAAPWRLSGPLAILLVHAYSMYVYFYLMTRAALQRSDPALSEAAAALGASPARTFWRVTLPLLQPALAGAALLTFMTALASFSAPYLFGGNFRVMTTEITSSKLNGDVSAAQAETVVLAAIAIGGLLLMRRLDRGEATGTGIRGVAPARRRLRSPLARAAAAALGWSLAAFLLLPHATLALVSLVPVGTWTTEAWPPLLNLRNYRELFSTAERLRPLANSLWMAAVATLAALVLGFLAARSAARARAAQRQRSANLLETLLALPWALPGTVFAVALAAAWSVHQPWFLRFVLVGTPAILPLAYLARSLPLTGRAAIAGLKQLDPALEEAAAALGASPARTLLRVLLPLLYPALFAGAGIAFITALGDFVTSVVLYTYETRPISIEILSALRVQELGIAAAYGVVLMVLSAAAFLIWGEREPERRDHV
jgi:iron(III) transport system permease protein